MDRTALIFMGVVGAGLLISYLTKRLGVKRISQHRMRAVDTGERRFFRGK